MREHTPRRTVDLAIMAERIGARFYEKLAGRSAGEVARIFETLARDEKDHEATFARLLEIAPADDPLTAHEYGRDEYLRAVAVSELVRGPLSAELDDIRTPADALRIGAKQELASILFYQGVRDALGPSPILDALVAEEKRHFTVLVAELERHVG